MLANGARQQCSPTVLAKSSRHVSRLTNQLTNFFLDAVWRLRPTGATKVDRLPAEIGPNDTSHDGETLVLYSLISRFPFWKRGRLLLAEKSLAANDVATAYAEAQALKTLAKRGSRTYAMALLLLGQSFLRRGDGATALRYLNEASELLPNHHKIIEERAAALCLEGDRATALRLLMDIPEERLSAEGKAALSWLSQSGAAS